MGKSLIIVESPAKVKSLSSLLGSDYLLESFDGFVTELPESELAIDINNGFEPIYVSIDANEKILKKLVSAASGSDLVYLAMNPDCAGEEIAWHLSTSIARINQNIKRLPVFEITRTAVHKALNKMVPINTNWVNHQKARMVMDYLTSYQTRTILQKYACGNHGLTRTQILALHFICEREQAIETFQSTESWGIQLELKAEKTGPFLVKLDKIADEWPQVPNKPYAMALGDDLKHQDFVIRNLTCETIQQPPEPPFTTCMLIQEAFDRFGLAPITTMTIARQLFEGIELERSKTVGLITYPRTKSTHIASEIITSIRELILTNYGIAYLPNQARRFSENPDTDDINEAIRPTKISRLPKSIKKYLNNDQFKLYDLIWRRLIASQMQNAQIDQFKVDITAGEADRYHFRTTGTSTRFRGFMQVYETSNAKSAGSSNHLDNLMKGLSVGAKCKLLDLAPQQQSTEPPVRFSESSLIAELDKSNIGRPDNFISTLQELFLSLHIQKVDNYLIPNDLGKIVDKIIILNFPALIDVQFIERLERQIDLIKCGEREYLEVMKAFYPALNQPQQRSDRQDDELSTRRRTAKSEKCPLCGQRLVVKQGKWGRFMACVAYPVCKFSKSVDETTMQPSKTCDVCGKEMVIKVGRYGKFFACSNYPGCKATKPYTIGIKCPNHNCNGEIIERRSTKGNIFYGCSNYPACKFATPHKLIDQICINCGHKFLEERYSESTGRYFRCSKCKIEYSIDLNLIRQDATS